MSEYLSRPSRHPSKIADFLDAASRDHFAQVLAALDACGVPTLSTSALSAASITTPAPLSSLPCPPPIEAAPVSTPRTPCSDAEANDGLSEMLGPKAPGIDLAIGQGRLILTPQVRAKEQPMPRLDAYFSSSALPRSPTFSLSPAISAAPTYQWWKSVTVPFENRRIASRHIVLLGKDELAANLHTAKRNALVGAPEPTSNIKSLYPPSVIQLKMNRGNGPGVDID